MRQSKLFTKTRREAPSDETAKNAQLLIRAGFIHKEMAGVYSLLPLGLRVIRNIKNLVASELSTLESNELHMSTLQSKEVWQKTNRWDDFEVDVWFKSRLKSDTEVGFGWSHEEPITELLKSHVASYQDLPIAVHQFQNKLRNEVRAKSGIMRSREFVMKDMYYFARSEAENIEFYNKVIEVYKNIFEKLGLGEITYVTTASGGAFTDKFSHEFQTICEAGEDVVYLNKEKGLALNEEIWNKETLAKMEMKEADPEKPEGHGAGFEKVKTAEVGNIFNFGSKKCEQMGLTFTAEDGTESPVFLSSYGIGITRLMGVLVEVFGNEKGMVWPEAISPFKFQLIELNSENPEVKKKAEAVYEKLGTKNTLYDDRSLRAGEKFADADLVGIPYQIIVSEKNLESEKLEFKNRKTGETKMISLPELQTLT